MDVHVLFVLFESVIRPISTHHNQIIPFSIGTILKSMG